MDAETRFIVDLDVTWPAGIDYDSVDFSQIEVKRGRCHESESFEDWMDRMEAMED